jgi:hypothetical protein
MLALDSLAGVKQILLFITEDTSMALQAFTAVGECVDGQAGAMYTSAGEENYKHENAFGRGGQNAGRQEENGG